MNVSEECQARARRFAPTARAVGLCLLGGLLGAHRADADCVWDPVVQALQSAEAESSKRVAQNLVHLCKTVTADQIKHSLAAQTCLGQDSPIFAETDVALLQSTLEHIATDSLKILLPSVGALLESTPVAAIGAFLAPTAIGKDALDVISHPQSYSRADLIGAAKELAWDTDPAAFRTLSGDRKATIEGCLFAP
jgi:hypothetical protein